MSLQMYNNDKLRKLMKEHRLTRAHAARLMHVSPSTVDRYLTPMRHANGQLNATWRHLPNSRFALFTHELKAERAKSKKRKTRD